VEFTELAGIVLRLLGLVGVGWVLRVTGLLASEDARPIHTMIIYVGLPALVFQAVHPARLSTEFAVIAAVAWLVFATSALIAWVASYLLRLPRPVAGGFIIAASLGNTGYIGYPVSQAMLGDEGLVRAVFYDVFGTVGALLLVGLLIAQRFGSREGHAVNPVREVLRFPAVIALAVAFALRPFAIPEVVSSGLDSLASLVVPLIMISVGLTLEMRGLAKHSVALSVLGFIRLLVAPVVAVVVGSLVLLDAEAVRLVALEAGMPTMMLSIVIGARFGLDIEFLTSAVVFTTVAAVVSIPLVQLVVA